MEPRLKNWKNYPPPGGWGMTISVKGQTFLVAGHNPDDVVNKIAARQRQNGVFKGMQPIWDMANTHWCKKAPERCGGVEAMEAAQSNYIPPDNTLTTPAEYGARLWAMLDTFGMKGAFDAKRWESAIKHLEAILNPSVNEATGCSTCWNEWIEINRVNPWTNVTSSAEAARWVFETHNHVNRKCGKPQFAWARAVKKNAWEV